MGWGIENWPLNKYGTIQTAQKRCVNHSFCRHQTCVFHTYTLSFTPHFCHNAWKIFKHRTLPILQIRMRLCFAIFTYHWHSAYHRPHLSVRTKRHIHLNCSAHFRTSRVERWAISDRMVTTLQISFPKITLASGRVESDSNICYSHLAIGWCMEITDSTSANMLNSYLFYVRSSFLLFSNVRWSWTRDLTWTIARTRSERMRMYNLVWNKNTPPSIASLDGKISPICNDIYFSYLPWPFSPSRRKIER